jgi:uncharacterized RDD family membrane protein YckC
MTTNTKDGVFYRMSDYAGIRVRLCIVAIDLVILWILIYLLSIVAESSEFLSGAFVSVCFILCYAYLAVLKSTPLGTIGYMLAGVKLVDLRGQQASLWRSTFRFGFLVIGPMNPLFDIIWLGGDPNKQSLRDKFAGTYVVRDKAPHAGHGPIAYQIYCMFGYNFIFAEVTRTPAKPEDGQLPSETAVSDEPSP